jgi:hypothetical protein
VVDSRIEADFIEKNDPRPAGVRVQRPHGLADIRGGDQILFFSQAEPGDDRVKDVGHKADDEIGPLDFIPQGGFVVQVEDDGPAALVRSGQGPGFFRLDVSHRNPDIRFFQERADQRAGDEAGPDDEQVFHRFLSFREDDSLTRTPSCIDKPG